MSNSKIARTFFEDLWLTRDENDQLWQKEVKLWRSYLPSLPQEIQECVYANFIQELRF